MNTRNIKLIIEYDGTSYCGWQTQARDRTIQGEVTNAIEKTTGQSVNLIAAGRTDAGVHALGQAANFRFESDFPLAKMAPALNYHIDNDIRIHEASEVAHDFHARFDARSKRYRYMIGGQRSALYRTLRWENSTELDYGLLQEAARIVRGEHDFAPFCVLSSRKANNACRIDHARWYRMGGVLIFEIRGNRFLHNMVRRLVGAMVNLATVQKDNNTLNLTLSGFRDIINSATDEGIVFTAPAHGLYLVSVSY